MKNEEYNNMVKKIFDVVNPDIDYIRISEEGRFEHFGDYSELFAANVPIWNKTELLDFEGDFDGDNPPFNAKIYVNGKVYVEIKDGKFRHC